MHGDVGTSCNGKWDSFLEESLEFLDVDFISACIKNKLEVVKIDTAKEEVG